MLRFTIFAVVIAGFSLKYSVAQPFIYSFVPNVEDVQLRENLTNNNTYRLPNNTRPIAYDIDLRTWIHEGNFTFVGNVLIDIVILEVSSAITLHHRQLNIHSIELFSEDGIVPIALVEYNAVFEFLTITINYPLPAGGRYSLAISYSGILRLDESGFYRSSYLNDNGDTVWLATTEFHSTDARHGFPCYDEPALKARFSISITHDPSYFAISNMPVSSQDRNTDASITTHFEETPPTSTYLIAFIVSDLEFLENDNNESVPHRTFARPNAIHLTKLALETGVRMLDALANYIGVNYTLPKMDQIAVPNFTASGRENWGLVTYRESSFLHDENTSTQATRSVIVGVLGHEFAHQWFGNLVTPSWWTYLWLSEGFATFYGNLGVDLINTNWGNRDYFIITTLQNVMRSDALAASHPMTNHIESPSAIAAMFDNIVYGKSAMVIRMFLRVCSRDTFVKGIKYYLEERLFSDATEEHLFEGLQRAVEEDNTVLPPNTNIAILMSSWTRQTGFPLVSVTRDYNTPGNVTFTQQRYVSESPSSTPNNSVWWIPYIIALASDENPELADEPIHWLSQPEESHYFSAFTNNDWLVVNKLQYGYYRVLYDKQNYELIVKALNSNMTQIYMLNRATLIDDAYNFAETNLLSYEVFFDLIQYLEHEQEFSPWYTATQAFTTLNNRFDGQPTHAVFKDFVRNLVEHLFDTVGIVDDVYEARLIKYSRPIAIYWACNMGSVHCRSDTTRALRQLMSSDGEFHQNVKDVMYCAALRSGNRRDYEFVWNRALTANNSIYRYMLIDSLGCTSSSLLLAEFLNSSLSSTNNGIEYKAGDEVRVFNSVYQSGSQGMRMALTFLTVNLNEAFETFGRDNFENIITGMAEHATYEMRNQFNIILYTAMNLNYIDLSILTRVLEVISENQLWFFTHGYTIINWLSTNHEGHVAEF